MSPLDKVKNGEWIRLYFVLGLGLLFWLGEGLSSLVRMGSFCMGDWRQSCPCQVRNISHKVEEKEEVVMSEAVGLDLYSSFQQQEFTDFEIVCEDKNLQCHKVVLAARSPVFRFKRRSEGKIKMYRLLTGQCC